MDPLYDIDNQDQLLIQPRRIENDEENPVDGIRINSLEWQIRNLIKTKRLLKIEISKLYKKHNDLRREIDNLLEESNNYRLSKVKLKREVDLLFESKMKLNNDLNQNDD